MLISKSVGTWGEGANDAVFELEVVGHTPDEVKHLESLASEPSSVSASYANGALKFAVTFTRKLSLEEQRVLKVRADAKAKADAKAAADKAEADAQAKAKADQDAADEQSAEREARIRARAQEIVNERAQRAAQVPPKANG